MSGIPKETKHSILSHKNVAEVEGREKSGHKSKVSNLVSKYENLNNPLLQISKKPPPKMTPVIKISDKKSERGINQVNFGLFNPGGLNSAKSACISNICEVNDLKVIIVSETGSSGNQIPVINAKMKSFHRNRRRDAQCRVGIAIFVHEDLAEDAVLLEKGAEEDNDEFVIIKINTFSPPMVVVGVYGSQENGPRSETRDRWRRIFALMNKYKSQGCLGILARAVLVVHMNRDFSFSDTRASSTSLTAEASD